MSYLVMECKTGYAVVLDNQGRFQKVPNLGYEVGETLDFVTIFPNETVVPLVRKKMASLVAAAACFLLLFAGYHQLLITAYGTVRIQINPDVMLEINRLDYVIGLEGLNEDGSRLIEEYRYRGKRLEAVSEELADLAMEEGYLGDGGEIVLTVESKHEKWRADKETALTERISTHLEQRVSVKVSAVKTERDHDAGEDELHHGSQKDGMTGPPETERGNVGSPVYHTRDDDDFDDIADDEEDDRADADDDEEDGEDDRADVDDDEEDGEDDRADVDDDEEDRADNHADDADDGEDREDDHADDDDEEDRADDRADADDDGEDREDDHADDDDEEDRADDRADADDDGEDREDDYADTDDEEDDDHADSDGNDSNDDDQDD